MGGGAILPGVSTADWRAKAFDVLSDATKQMITVGSGIVTATAIFSKDLPAIGRGWVMASWIFLTLSVIFGCFVLFNISGQLLKAANNGALLPTIATAGIRFFSILQILVFGAGVALVFVFGAYALFNPAPPPAPTTVNCVVSPTPRPTPPPAPASLPTPVPQPAPTPIPK